MKALIEKELCNPVMVDGHLEVPGPLYHIYLVDDDGTKTFVETVEGGDIKEAAAIAQRKIDFNVLEVAYKKDPLSFRATLPTDWMVTNEKQISNDDDERRSN